jgi:hypothetical protein
VTISPEDLALYVIGAYDGDAEALERAIAADPALAAALADEARFELQLRAAAAVATFCPGCGDLVRDARRCLACGCAVAPGGYVVERVLVANAHGRMYVARDADGAQVALKELAFVQAPTLEMIAAFEREAKLLRALDHPAIPRFVASFEEGEGVHVRYYLAQELVAGQALDAALETTFFSEPEIIALARQVLDVLVYLQGLSPMVIHRDLKPANLLRRPDGSIAVVDFGAAHAGGATAGSTTIGTFGYMPIEQLAGQVDATTDPYALGTSLLHLLSRREPWRPQLIDSINVSPALRTFIATLTAREPRDRFPTALAARAALDRAARGERPMTTLRSASRARPFLFAAAAVAMAGLGAGGYALLQPAAAPPAPVAIAPVVAADASAPTWYDDARLAAQPGDPLPAGPTIDLDFKEAPLVAVLGMLTERCGFGLAVPDSVGGRITVRFAAARCDQALEVVIHGQGLAYEYRRAGNLVRVLPRPARADQPERDDLPTDGERVSLDLENAPLHDVVRTLAKAGNVNIVLPDSVGGRVTVHVQDTRWDHVLRGVLAVQELRYHYQPNGRMIRVATGP